MASGDVSPSKSRGPPRTKIIEENIDTIKNLVGEKPNFSISEVSNEPVDGYCVEDFEKKHWENIHINLKLSKVLPINTSCVEYNFTIEIYSKTNMNSCGWKKQHPSKKMSDTGLTVIPMLKLIVSNKEISCAGLA